MSENYIEKYLNNPLPSLFIKKEHNSDDNKVHKKAYGVVTPPVDTKEYSLERRLREMDELSKAAGKDIFIKNFNGKDYHDRDKSRKTFYTVCGSILASVGLYFLFIKKNIKIKNA